MTLEYTTQKQREMLRVYSGHLRKFLKQLREKLGLSQEEVALKAGLGIKQVGRLERGENDPRFSTVFLIGLGLGLTPEEFLEQWLLFLREQDIKASKKMVGRFFSEDGTREIELWEKVDQPINDTKSGII